MMPVILADNFDLLEEIKKRRKLDISYKLLTDDQIAQEIERERSGPIIPPPPKLEEINTKLFGDFLKKTYQDWGHKPEVVAKAGEIPIIRHPKDIDWPNTIQAVDSKFGEFTINPDTAHINWETIPKDKIRVFPFSEFVGKISLSSGFSL